MKRKRGSKKGKKKGPPKVAKSEEAANLVTLIEEDNSGSDDDGGKDDGSDNGNNSNNEEEYEHRMEVDTPSSTGTDQPLNLASINPDGSIDKTAPAKSVGRVKVKLKTSKAFESHSDTDKSSLQLGLEKHNVANDKMEDTGNSVFEVKTAGVSVNMLKKPGSIKIKSSKVMGGLSVEKSGNVVMTQDENLQQKEPRTPCQVSQYNMQELDSALEVIKKVMKMDAAEPFNAPVNPEALGIPDYFDIIDTPMDFGTICSNIETGGKYMNSEDVYKDVQFIWDNCYKYNNKGDYILGLMRRVKKNFMKYWTAVGLFTESSRGSSGAEGAQGDDAGASSQGHVKSGQLKQKSKKRHGRRHKSDCLCAICVLKRRRREREENERIANQKLAQELKQEGSSLMESLAGEDSSSNMDESLDPDGDGEVEGKGLNIKMEDTEQQYSADKEKHEEVEEEDEEEDYEDEEENELEIQKKGKVETLEQSEFTDNRSGSEPNQQSQHGQAEHAGGVTQTMSQKGRAIGRHDDEAAAVQRNKIKESLERQQKAKMFDKFRQENPMLVSLCRTLFPDNHRSVWSGPHSLVPPQGSAPKNSISAAIETLMK